MLKYQNILIVSDLDGTFLGKNSRIVPRNVEAIRAFCAQGGQFTFATGRHHHHLLEGIPILAELVNTPAIVANGAYLYDCQTKQLIGESFMDTDLTVRALHFARNNFPSVGFRLSTQQGVLTDGRTEYMQQFVEAYRHKEHSYVIEVAPIEKWTQRLWYKVVFRGKCEDLDALNRALQKEFGGQFEYNKSSDTFLEIQKAGISKGTMLHVLQQSYAAVAGSPIKTYGVGDFENDLSLLRAADVAVCPANAHPDVKREANLILCDHDEGVIADLIERL